MKTRRDFLKLAGAAMVGSTGVASAAENPFGFKKMDAGYTQVAEMKCGGQPAPKPAEGKCGGQPAPKQPEGRCGGQSAPKQPEGRCGGQPAPKQPEMKCGEGKCGGNMS
ncbi:twin-arginine translocation signal domain-containing protein [Thiomicrorhabdus sediminis]|nr:twin-arginine translocation signal domain-containing protein [Thiomicrorhabdus sediminis]